ncbi:MAG: 2-hydroxy-3-oxopropionate reductase [Pyrinomonadaceae bacterium]
MEGEKTKVGFIGLGIMGKPMVRNLLKAGFLPRVFNRSAAAIEELFSEGAIAAVSAKAVAEASEIVITMLPDSPDVEAVVLGDDGVLAGAREGLLLIDMSTISPVVTRRIAGELERAGVRMLDAPVSGGDKGAIAGTLSIMAGGDAKDFERARPLFEAMGKTIRHCGPIGSGQVVKACNQIVVALVIEAVSEALVLGSKAGVDPQVILEVLGGGLAQNRVMELRGPTMIGHDFTPGFKARLHRKDMKIILETARELGVELPVSTIVDQMFADLLASGNGDLDHSSLLLVIEELSEHKVAVRA